MSIVSFLSAIKGFIHCTVCRGSDKHVTFDKGQLTMFKATHASPLRVHSVIELSAILVAGAIVAVTTTAVVVRFA